mgnify:CR=1 FL=1|tara:strand:+ start:516 stop:812 length:297 start_codon:yes stop_codon:yes gene_type:complete
MAITKTEEIAQIEIVQTCIIQVATDVVIKEDDVEISRSRKRHSIIPCGYSKEKDSTPSDWVWSDTDISGEDAQVQAVANAIWTDSVKNAYKAKMEAQG